MTDVESVVLVVVGASPDDASPPFHAERRDKIEDEDKDEDESARTLLRRLHMDRCDAAHARSEEESNGSKRRVRLIRLFLKPG